MRRAGYVARLKKMINAFTAFWGKRMDSCEYGNGPSGFIRGERRGTSCLTEQLCAVQGGLYLGVLSALLILLLEPE